MSERKLRTDSEVNRQLMNSMSRTKKIYQFFAVIIATAFISSAITLTISADVPESAPNTVIDWEGLEAYKINGIRYANPDDVDSIQDAIDDLGTDGGLVIVPDGAYTLTSTIRPTNHTALQVLGIMEINPASPKVGITIDGVHDILIVGGKINGNRASVSQPGPYTWYNGIRVNNSHNVQICGIHIQDVSGHGISVTYSQNVTLHHNLIEGFDDDGISCEVDAELPRTENIWVTDNVICNGESRIGSSSGIELEHYVRKAFISNNVISNVTGKAAGNGGGIQLSIDAVYAGDYVKEVVIDGNSVFNCGDSGVALMGNSYSDGKTVRDVVITHNVFQNIYDDAAMGSGNAFRANIACNITFSGNIIRDTEGPAIWVSTGARNITISGNDIRDAYCGVFISAGSYDIAVLGNMIADVTYTSGGAIQAQSNGRVAIMGNEVHGYGLLAGIYVTSTGDNTVVSNNIVLGAMGIRIDADNATVTDNRIVCSNTGLRGIACTYGYFSGNSIEVPSIGSTYGIRLTDGDDYCLITNNDLTGATAKLSVTGTHHTIRYNLGYVTENSGSATISGAVNTVTVNHGLASTPTIVQVTGNNTGIGYYVVTSVSSTQFVITFENQPLTSTWKFYWYAQYWP